MSDPFAADTRFEGFGVTDADPAMAAASLATRLNEWLRAHPGRRILHVSVQSSAIGASLHVTALVAYSDDLGAAVLLGEADAMTTEDVPVAVSLAEEIVAEAQHDSDERG